MRKLNFLPIIIFLINLLSIVHSQKNIGLIDGTIGYGDNYGFTSRPESSDIIIVVDLDLITKILSGHSVLGTILKNYNSSTKKIVKTIDGEVKVFDDSQSIEELMITDITDDGEIIFLSNGSIYEVIYESYKTTLWLSYSNVFLIDDKKIIKDGDEVKVRKIDEKIKKSSIRRISDDKNYIYLYDGTVYYTIDISVYLWFEDNFVMVIGDTQLINEFNRDRINVIRVE